MLNRISLLTAVCMTASMGLFVVNSPAADEITVTRTTTVVPGDMKEGDLKLPAGITAKNFNDDKSIDKAFKALTDDALSKNGFDNLVSKLVDQDRDRIKNSVMSGRSLTNIDGSNNKRLQDLVADIEGGFKTKYNTKFDIDVGKVYTPGFAHIMTGEVSDPPMLIGKWPVGPLSMGNPNEGSAKVTAGDANQAANKAFGGDVNLEKGRKVALTHIVSSHGMKGFTASLIHENLVGWKFDVPNTITAEKLYGNLVNNLTYLSQHKEQWPSDVNDAYRQFTHASLAALYDINIGTDAGTASGLDAGSPRPTEATNR